MADGFLTEKRRDMLATYALNISVASFAVAVFEHVIWGAIPAVFGILAFLILTTEGEKQ